MWWSIVCALLGFAFIGGFGFFLACLIPGYHDYRSGKSHFFPGITEEQHPVRYWIGTFAWFGLALTFLIGAVWVNFIPIGARSCR